MTDVISPDSVQQTTIIVEEEEQLKSASVAATAVEVEVEGARTVSTVETVISDDSNKIKGHEYILLVDNRDNRKLVSMKDNR